MLHFAYRWNCKHKRTFHTRERDCRFLRTIKQRRLVAEGSCLNCDSVRCHAIPQQPCGKQRLSCASFSKDKATLKGFLKAFAGQVLPKGFRNAKLPLLLSCCKNSCKMHKTMKTCWEAFVGEVLCEVSPKRM